MKLKRKRINEGVWKKRRVTIEIAGVPHEQPLPARHVGEQGQPHHRRLLFVIVVFF